MEQIEGYFLAFNNEEKKIIDEGLLIEGYQPGELKKFLIDYFSDVNVEEREGRESKVKNFFAEHPEVLQAGFNVLKNVIQKRRS